jgi:hypothetical protein
VKQRAVHDRAEPAVIAGERADVGNLEAGVAQTAPCGLGAGEFDGGGRNVEAHRGVTPLGQIQRHRGLTAADVEDFVVKLALFDQRGEFGLWLTQAPWRARAQPKPDRLAAVRRIEFEVVWCCHDPPWVVENAVSSAP